MNKAAKSLSHTFQRERKTAGTLPGMVINAGAREEAYQPWLQSSQGATFTLEPMLLRSQCCLLPILTPC